MKECTSCRQVRDDFSPQKRHPDRLYAWCDECRASGGVDRLVNSQFKPSLKSEYKELREKAISLRKFSPEQDIAIAKRYTNGEKVKDLASEYKVSNMTIYKAVNRGKKGAVDAILHK